MKYAITGGTIVTPEEILKDSAVVIENDRIKKVGVIDKDIDFVVNLKKDFLIFPGLINAHDHMLGTYYPRVGSGPYISWLPWDDDLKSHPLYKERNKIESVDLYLLCAYRNMISGVTTVSDHIPHTVNKDFIDKMPVRVIKDYSLEHECSSADLRWGRGITLEHSEAVKSGIPFITHIEEGFDEESTLGIDILNELNVLDEYTVLIHGIAFSKEDIKLISEKKANVVWCPASNYFMFKTTTDIKELLQKRVNVSLGTDSSMSGSLNLLEEMKFASSLYKKLYGERLDDKTLVNMVTINPAKAFRLKGLGRIEEGYLADLLIINEGNPDRPYESLVKATIDNVEMVLSNGIPIYGYENHRDYFNCFRKDYQKLNINERERIIIGKPVELYRRIWDNVGFKKILPFFPVNIN